jgi:protein-tyrosine kinase
MSKIFEAYKKRAGGEPDLSQEVTRAATQTLFPSPPGRQRLEFNELANSLLRLQKTGSGLALGFAASVAGEGASYVSHQVAIQLALNLRKRVIWIDGNFRDPQRKLGAGSSLSFAALLQAPDRLAELAPDASPVFLRGGTELARLMGYFAADSYARLIRQLTADFDFTILDLPPILEATETAVMAGSLDGLLLVIESKRLKWEVIKSGVDSLREKDVPVLGAVINRRRYELPKFIYDRI